MAVIKSQVTDQGIDMDTLVQVCEECEKVIDAALYNYVAGETVDVSFQHLHDIFMSYDVTGHKLDRVLAVLIEKYTNAEWDVVYCKAEINAWGYLQFS